MTPPDDPKLSGSGARRGPVRTRPATPKRRSTPATPPLAQTPGPDPDTPLNQARLAIGIVERPHGIRGEMQIRLTTDYPEHFTNAKQLFLGDEPVRRRLLGIRFHKGKALIRLDGITTPESVKALAGTPLRIPASEAKPLAEGEYFYFQLIGNQVVRETGELLGELTDILETGANEVYVVTPVDGNETLLLPNIPDVILSIDPAARRIVARPPEYL